MSKMPAANKQLATEQLQKWILFALAVIITALGAQNVQMTAMTRELSSLSSTVSSLVKVVDGNGDRILRLENYHFDRTPHKDPTVSVPIEVLPSDRRKLRIQ